MSDQVGPGHMPQVSLARQEPRDGQDMEALLTMGDYGGTLAAARLLGRKGVSVLLAEHRRWVPARFSRFVSRAVSCPPLHEWEAFMHWLKGQSAGGPRSFLYPTSDDTAWLYAAHAADLRRDFALYQPSVQVIYKLLNKKLLHDACERLGIATPRTFFPQSAAACDEAAAQLKPPFLLKPRTQIGLRVGHKGHLLRGIERVWSEYTAFKDQLLYQDELVASDPDVIWPMMQEYYEGAQQSIISVAGFIDRKGHIAARSSRKVLQRPRRLGVGLCFQSLPVDPVLIEQLLRLCRELGYYGVFEAEFIDDTRRGQRLLIDFNPRYYGQMGFEIARGLPLPYLALLGALGREHELEHELKLAAALDLQEPHIYATRWLLRLSLILGWIGGRHSGKELLRWRRWRRSHPYTDAVEDHEDPWPHRIDMMLNLGRYARHPRDFFRKFFLDT